MHLLLLMYIASVEPPVHLWNPLPYVKSWLVTGHRDATAINSRSRTSKKDDSPIWQCVWRVLQPIVIYKRLMSQLTKCFLLFYLH